MGLFHALMLMLILMGEHMPVAFPAGAHPFKDGSSFVLKGVAHTTSFMNFTSCCNSLRRVSKVEADSVRLGAAM